jgi:hypothetical protein
VFVLTQHCLLELGGHAFLTEMGPKNSLQGVLVSHSMAQKPLVPHAPRAAKPHQPVLFMSFIQGEGQSMFKLVTYALHFL